MKDLDEGQHKLSLRVWDVANNSAEASTYFIVASDANLALTEVLNYPNPATDEGTNFLIGYNQVGRDLDVQVRIFQSDGRVIKTLSGSFNSDGNYYRGLSWDGRTEQGGLISAGYYVYRVSLSDKENGRTVYMSNKLVVIK